MGRYGKAVAVVVAAVVAVVGTVWWQSAQVDDRETPATTDSDLVSTAPVPANLASSTQSVAPGPQAIAAKDVVEIYFESVDETLIDASIVTEIRGKPDTVRYRFVVIDTDHLRALIRDPEPKPLRIELFPHASYTAFPYARVEHHKGPRTGIASWNGRSDEVVVAQFVIGASGRTRGTVSAGEDVYRIEPTEQGPYHVVRKVSAGVKTF